MPSAIPDEQRQKIEPILDTLLEQLHERTQALTGETDLALQFEPELGP